VRHPGGKVEVPRVFSCAVAGVKPFWVYGPNPEVEAEKERKARREWRALVELARAKGDRDVVVDQNPAIQQFPLG